MILHILLGKFIIMHYEHDEMQECHEHDDDHEHEHFHDIDELSPVLPTSTNFF